MKIYYLAPGDRQVRLATINKPAPADALWTTSDPIEAGEKRQELKEVNRRRRNAIKRWKTKKARLETIPVSPAFKAYHKSIYDQHLAEKP